MLFGMGYLAWLLPLLALEAIVLGWQRSFFFRLMHWREHRSTLCDVAVSMLFVFGVAGWLSEVFALGGLDLIRQLVSLMPKFDVDLVLPQAGMRWLFYFVVIDFSDYWVHRAMHRFGPLWRLHSFHHAATEFNILTGNRIHFVEEALMVAGRAIVLAPLAVSLPEFFVLIMVRRVIDQLQHSELPWNYGIAGRTVLMSPWHHRLHHSRHPDNYRINFGNIFVWWDILFGSLRHPDVSRPIELGTDDERFDRQVALHPFRMMLVLQFQSMRDIWNGTRQWVQRVLAL